ncbi:pentapeptide repeat-containing protein [Streptomyces populi]
MELIKLSFGVVAGVGGVVALVVAYRRQVVDKNAEERDVTRLYTERFTSAVAQLGEHSRAVRLGGVHALVALADDAPDESQRETCIDVLCAYLRLPYRRKPDRQKRRDYRDYLAMREVRHTILRIIGDRLRIGSGDSKSWQKFNFDFTGVVFDGGDLSGAVFSGGKISFAGAEFTGDALSLQGAKFTKGHTSFDGAEFSGGIVNLRGAVFTGDEVSFDGAQFTGGSVDLKGANFSHGTLTFTHTKHFKGYASFAEAKFNGATVVFGSPRSFGTHKAPGSDGFFFVFEIPEEESNIPKRRIPEDILGRRIQFTEFSDRILTFRSAEFSAGSLDFGYMAFAGKDRILFKDARFCGVDAKFRNVRLNKFASFHGARFSGGKVDMLKVSGGVPQGLSRSGSRRFSPHLRVPERWRRPDAGTAASPPGNSESMT